MTSHILRPKVPYRAFVLACALAVLGLVLLLAAAVKHWLFAVTVVSLVLIAIGLIVAVMAAYSLRSLRVRVDLDANGYRVHGPGLDRRGTWARVTKVALTPDRSRLVIASGKVKRTYISCPKGGDDPEMKALIREITAHLSR